MKFIISMSFALVCNLYATEYNWPRSGLVSSTHFAESFERERKQINIIPEGSFAKSWLETKINNSKTKLLVSKEPEYQYRDLTPAKLEIRIDRFKDRTEVLEKCAGRYNYAFGTENYYAALENCSIDHNSRFAISRTILDKDNRLVLYTSCHDPYHTLKQPDTPPFSPKGLGKKTNLTCYSVTHGLCKRINKMRKNVYNKIADVREKCTKDFNKIARTFARLYNNDEVIQKSDEHTKLSNLAIKWANENTLFGNRDQQLGVVEKFGPSNFNPAASLFAYEGVFDACQRLHKYLNRTPNFPIKVPSKKRSTGTTETQG